MLRRIHQTALVLLLLVATGGGMFLYHTHNSPEGRLLRQADESLRQEKEAKEKALADLDVERKHAEELKRVVGRLETVRRVADIMVKPSTSAANLQTTLLFSEYARDGKTLLDTKEFTIDGKRAHIDALVVKFDGKFVEMNDPLRGHSIALFTRLFDETTSPEHGFTIDEPGHIPAIYRGADGKVSDFEQDLWKNFWKLAEDPSYRKSMGVRVAQGEGVWTNFEPGWLYTLTVDANGGLNLSNEPIKGIIQQALQDKATQPTTQTQPATSSTATSR